MKDKFIIDSNILIYMLNRNADEKHEKALEFVKKARSRKAAIPAQCLAETYYQVLKKDTETRKARKAIKDLKNSPSFQTLSYGKKELDTALEAEKNFWDRLIEATALKNGYETIYTENTQDFNKIESINPLE